MAGRGRVGGLTLTRDQLQALGIARGEKSTLKVSPPPLFPKLENKPLPLPVDPTTEYTIVLKQQFLDHLRESPSHVKEQVKSLDDTERYSDKYKILSHDLKGSGIVPCIWSHVPLELRPGKKPRKRKMAVKKDIESKLNKLEKLEMKEEVSDDDDNADQEDQEELEVADEEEEQIDEGTDYGNNYFDNGEGFEDEDDNLDDGPVY